MEMERIEIFGLQHQFNTDPTLLLERGGGQGYIGLRLSRSQLQVLEATSCRCGMATDEQPAVLAVARALGGRATGVTISLRQNETPLTWLAIRCDDDSATIPVSIDPIDALALVLRTGLPLLLVESSDPDELAGHLPFDAPGEPRSEPCELEVPTPFRSLLQSLDLNLTDS